MRTRNEILADRSATENQILEVMLDNRDLLISIRDLLQPVKVEPTAKRKGWPKGKPRKPK